jgi:hypothetical protein
MRDEGAGLVHGMKGMGGECKTMRWVRVRTSTERKGWTKGWGVKCQDKGRDGSMVDGKRRDRMGRGER